MATSQGPRRAGLSRKAKLRYGHLLQSLPPRKEERKPAVETEADIYAPPADSSEEDELAAPQRATEAAGVDDDDKLADYVSLPLPKRRKVGCSGGKEEEAAVALGQLGTGTMSCTSDGDDDADDDDKDPFGAIMSSQSSRRRTTTFRRQIHGTGKGSVGHQDKESGKGRVPSKAKSEDGMDDTTNGFRHPAKLKTTMGETPKKTAFKRPIAATAPPTLVGTAKRAAATSIDAPALRRFKAPPFQLPASSFPSAPSSAASSSSELSSPPSDLENDASFLSVDELARSPPPARAVTTSCPVCSAPVSRDVLAAFVDTIGRAGRLNYRQQARFCRRHRAASARTDWAQRNYPTIDWNQLPQRVEALHPTMASILNGGMPSHFRALLLRSSYSTAGGNGNGGGAARSLAQTLVNGGSDGAEDVGYYGGRGARIIADSLVAAFSSELRDLAAEDPLVAGAGGVGGYVQAVLVPETALRLVMLDMDLGEEGARRVLRESAQVGRLLCDDDDDDDDETGPWGGNEDRDGKGDGG